MGWQIRIGILSVVAVLLFMIGFGASTSWQELVALPQTYARLRLEGIPATAHLVVCAPGIGGGRGIGCRLGLRGREETRDWDYPENSGQFESLTPGAPVAMLVDPSDPTTAYTVRDVEEGTNAGWGPVVLFGIALSLGGLGGLAWFARFAIRLPRQ